MKELTQTCKATIRHTLQLYTMKGRIPERLRFMRFEREKLKKLSNISVKEFRISR